MPHAVFKVKGREIASLNLTGPTVVGRAGDCRVSVQDTLMSRHHLRLEPASNAPGQESWRLLDLNSSNGTMVDGERIKQHELTDGDLIEAGHLTIVYFEDALPHGGTGDAHTPLVIGETALHADATISAGISPHLPTAAVTAHSPATHAVTATLEMPSDAKTQVQYLPKEVSTRAQKWDELAKSTSSHRVQTPTLGEKLNSLPRPVQITAAALTGIVFFALAFYLTNLIAGS